MYINQQKMKNQKDRLNSYRRLRMSISTEQCIEFIKLQRIYYGEELLGMEEIELEEILREIKKDVIEEYDYEEEVAQSVYDLNTYDFITWYILTIAYRDTEWDNLLRSIVFKP
jgi:hypothetical protein